MSLGGGSVAGRGGGDEPEDAIVLEEAEPFLGLDQLGAAAAAELEAKEKTFGQTPLMFAAANNRVEALKALVKLGGS